MQGEGGIGEIYQTWAAMPRHGDIRNRIFHRAFFVAFMP